MVRVRERVRTRRAWAVVGILLLGAGAGVVALELAPPTRAEVGPGSVELGGQVALHGRTHLEIPPLGSARASTHSSPLGLTVRVTSIDIPELESLLQASRPTRVLYDQASSDVGGVLRRFAFRSALAAVIGGAIAGALATRRHLRSTLLGATGGLVAVGALFGTAWATYDTEAFRQPVYRGALERAPQVIEAVRRHAEGFEAVRDRVDVVGRQLSELYALALTDDRASLGAETRILHVSDIHSNPLGMELVGRLADHFDVDAVLDTGDVTSFGFDIESAIGDQIARVPVPYLFVPGNHDSPANREALAQVENLEVVDEEPVQVGGVTIVGVADPTFTAENEIDSDEAAEQRRARSGAVSRLVRRSDPDVLAVHDARMAEDSFGLVPLILHGHRHVREAEQIDGTWRLGVGSTGATGLGTFTVEEGFPYEAQVLHFSSGCLTSLDYVRLTGIRGDFLIDRRVLDLVPDDYASGQQRCVEADEVDPESESDSDVLPPVPDL